MATASARKGDDGRLARLRESSGRAARRLRAWVVGGLLVLGAIAALVALLTYRSAVAPPDSPAAQELYRQLLDGQIDAVTFTSATAVRRFAALIGEEQAADLLNTTVVAVIGPVTAAAAVALGVRAVIVPESYTVPGLVDALVRHFNATDTVKA